MQSLLPILIMPLITFLSSCKDNFPTIEPKERCFVVFTDYSENSYKGYCRCHQYGWSSESIGRVSNSTNYDLKKCDRLVGFSIEDSATIYQWQESIRYWLLRQRDK